MTRLPLGLLPVFACDSLCVRTVTIFQAVRVADIRYRDQWGRRDRRPPLHQQLFIYGSVIPLFMVLYLVLAVVFSRLDGGAIGGTELKQRGR